MASHTTRCGRAPNADFVRLTTASLAPVEVRIASGSGCWQLANSTVLDRRTDSKRVPDTAEMTALSLAAHQAGLLVAGELVRLDAADAFQRDFRNCPVSQSPVCCRASQDSGRVGVFLDSSPGRVFVACW